MQKMGWFGAVRGHSRSSASVTYSYHSVSIVCTLLQSDGAATSGHRWRNNMAPFQRLESRRDTLRTLLTNTAAELIVLTRHANGTKLFAI